MCKSLQELLEDNNVSIDWEFITHDERENLISRSDEIKVSKIQETEKIDQGSSIEYIYNAYIESVKAFITIRYYGSYVRDLFY